MKRELGIARCGLACCLCSKNDICAGCDFCSDKEWCENRNCSISKNLSHCYKCSELCEKGLLAQIKSHTFTLFANEDDLIAFILTGKKQTVGIIAKGEVQNVSTQVSHDESKVSQKAYECHPIPAPRGGYGARRCLLRFYYQADKSKRNLYQVYLRENRLSKYKTQKTLQKRY